MNIDEFNKENEALYSLMKERIDEPENHREIIYDGVMKPDLYFENKIRLAWMLKEPYDELNGVGGGWRYHEMFPEDKDLYLHTFRLGHRSTWHPIIYISYGIFNEFMKYDDMSWLRDKHEMCDIVRQVAFINSQKLPSKGLTNTNYHDLKEALVKYSDLLLKQIELINPNVFIFANTIDLYKDLLNLDLTKLKSMDTCQYIQIDDKLYISAYHPSQKNKGLTRDKYVNDIIGVVEEFSRRL
jgi:hypothetical protein